MHLTREGERRIGGGSPILPWILMVQDIAFASIYTRASPRYIVLLISSPNKKGFTAEDNGPSLSRFDFEEGRSNRPHLSSRVAEKPTPASPMIFYISSFLLPFPFFDSSRSVFYVLTGAIKSQLHLFSPFPAAIYRRVFVEKNIIATVTFRESIANYCRCDKFLFLEIYQWNKIR